MAASLSSAGADPVGRVAPSPSRPAARAPGEAGIATAPSIRLPLGFILCGLVCLPGVIALLIARPTILSTYHYNQHVIAATHLALLGWIGSVVFGVLYQLVPVALETRLASQRLAFVHLLCHAVAVPGMVWSFWHWNLKQVGHWGSIFALGVTLLLLNVGWTAIRSRRWNPVSAGMGSALGWLLAAAMAGLALAASKCSYESLERLSAGNPLAMTLRSLEAISTFVTRFDQMSAMHTHAHLGVLGGFVLLTVTLSLKLLPMFLLSETQNPRRAWWVIGLLNAGLLGLAVTMATRSPWKLVFAGLLTTALLLHALELRAMLRARKRRLLDWPLRMFLSGLTVTVPLAGLAGVLSWPGLPLTVVTGQLENLYGFLAVFGLISTAILGMLFKILSFLVWYGTYSPHLGRARVPNLADMYSEHRLRAGAMAYALALTLVCAGILISSAGTVRWGGIAMAAAVALHLSNYGLILGHLWKPRWQPVAARRGQSAGTP